MDDSRVGAAGRTVKCSNCGARWTAMPDGAAVAPAPAPKPPPPPAPPAPVATVDEIVFEPPPSPPPPAAKPARKPAVEKKAKVAGSPVVVWIGAAVAASALIAGAIVFRGQIVQMVPASAAAYAGLGMPVSALVIEKVHADAAFQGGRPVLQISGQLRNQRSETADAPPLKVSLLDWTGKPVAVKVARPIEAPVPGKAVRYFAVTLVDPPLSVHDLEVTFQTEGRGAPPVKAPVSAAPAAPPAK
ncbi:MAG: DUF3426 domain-containing protein [Proteobacteria bacterium]|nr:DUF3426 domain-containing protein [Pseudomonadota bacterium]